MKLTGHTGRRGSAGLISVAVATAVMAGSAAATGTGSGVGIPPASTVSSGATQTVQPIGVSAWYVSKDGRYVLGRMGSKMVVRDIVRNRTVRTLPKSGRHYTGLSDDGRFIAFEKSVVRRVSGRPCRISSPYVLNRVTNRTQSVAMARSGKPIPLDPTDCIQDPDSEEAMEWAGFSHSTISGNGRFVAFASVQHEVVYVKDMKSRSLQRYVGQSGGSQLSISEDGRVLGDSTGQLTVDGQVRVLPSGILPQGLTRDGRSIYSVGGRYEVRSGVVTPLAAGDPFAVGSNTAVQNAMSRRGRYATWSCRFPSQVTPGTTGESVGVYDRATGIATDLTAAMEAAGVAGYEPRPGDAGYCTAGGPISGGGTVAFVGSNAVRWMGLKG